MPAELIKVKATYLKPLLPSRFSDLSVATALNSLKRELLRRIKAQLLQTTFSDRAKKALAKAVKIEVKPSSLIITARHPAWRPLVEGQRAGQMTWLTKARRPIPIVTESGELIFRSATPKSMADGKWMHPGRAPSNFVEKARQQAREFMRTKLYREYVSQLQRSMARR